MTLDEGAVAFGVVLVPWIRALRVTPRIGTVVFAKNGQRHKIVGVPSDLGRPRVIVPDIRPRPTVVRFSTIPVKNIVVDLSTPGTAPRRVVGGAVCRDGSLTEIVMTNDEACAARGVNVAAAAVLQAAE